MDKKYIIHPKDDCKRCYGRGNIGHNRLSNKPVLCECITKQVTIGKKHDTVFNAVEIVKHKIEQMDREQLVELQDHLRQLKEALEMPNEAKEEGEND